jgi:hypothetical protein
MLTGLAALETTDWSRLHHAYGPATDTPAHLHALLEGDEQARHEAMSHLWSAIIHQGSPWTATGPVALVIAGLLSDERIDCGAGPVAGESLRASLLSFLVSVAEAAESSGCSREELESMAGYDLNPFIDAHDEEALFGAENENAANSFFAHSVLCCIKAVPVLMEVMLEGMASANPRVRACAAMGAVTLARSPLLANHATDLESRLAALAQSAQDSDERSAHVLALGALGLAPRNYLRDPSPAVRMCAALAPCLDDDPAATNELIQALENAGSMDSWFTEIPPQFDLRPRFSVVTRLVERVPHFEHLVDAAVAVAGVTSKYCVDFDWGPLLVAAFGNSGDDSSDKDRDGRGRITTGAQRRFLEALVDNEELWDPHFANASLWFQKAHLPYDRRLCATMIR